MAGSYLREVNGSHVLSCRRWMDGNFFPVGSVRMIRMFLPSVGDTTGSILWEVTGSQIHSCGRWLDHRFIPAEQTGTRREKFLCYTQKLVACPLQEVPVSPDFCWLFARCLEVDALSSLTFLSERVDDDHPVVKIHRRRTTSKPAAGLLCAIVQKALFISVFWVPSMSLPMLARATLIHDQLRRDLLLAQRALRLYRPCLGRLDFRYTTLGSRVDMGWTFEKGGGEDVCRVISLETSSTFNSIAYIIPF